MVTVDGVQHARCQRSYRSIWACDPSDREQAPAAPKPKKIMMRLDWNTLRELLHLPADVQLVDGEFNRQLGQDGSLELILTSPDAIRDVPANMAPPLYSWECVVARKYGA
jgi:hypothetical protein